MTAFPRVTIGEIAKVKGGKRLPQGAELIEEATAHPYLRIVDFRDDGLDDVNVKFISPEVHAAISRYTIGVRDVYVSIAGTIGRVGMVPTRLDGANLTENAAKVCEIDDRALPQFIMYFLRCKDGQDQLAARAGGAAQPKLALYRIETVEVPLPPLPTQQRIAAILSAYDDLIENNTRRIAILEEMARRLYEEWFVHFRFPGHETAEFDGDLPRGWRAVTLADVASVNPEAIKPKSAPERVRYIDIASVSPGRIDTVQELSFSEAPGRARRIVRDGDVIWSCVRPNRRSFALVLDPADDTVASTGFAVLRAGAVPFSYLYCATSTDAFVDYLTNNATGAAYPAVKQSDFERAELLMPSASALAAFDQAALPLLRLSDALHRKNANLRAQRDLLLPKLVSGEIDVSNQEETAMEAAE